MLIYSFGEPHDKEGSVPSWKGVLGPSVRLFYIRHVITQFSYAFLCLHAGKHALVLFNFHVEFPHGALPTLHAHTTFVIANFILMSLAL